MVPIVERWSGDVKQLIFEDTNEAYRPGSWAEILLRARKILKRGRTPEQSHRGLAESLRLRDPESYMVTRWIRDSGEDSRIYLLDSNAPFLGAPPVAWEHTLKGPAARKLHGGPGLGVAE
jgi:hypothetical protein